MRAEVEAWFIELPEAQRQIALTLRHMILECSPALEEKMRYKIPFYYFGRPCFYLNAAKQTVALGFYYGAALDDEQGLLTGAHLKQVRHYAVADVKDLREKELGALLFQSLDYVKNRRK